MLPLIPAPPEVPATSAASSVFLCPPMRSTARKCSGSAPRLVASRPRMPRAPRADYVCGRSNSLSRPQPITKPRQARVLVRSIPCQGRCSKSLACTSRVCVSSRSNLQGVTPSVFAASALAVSRVGGGSVRDGPEMKRRARICQDLRPPRSFAHALAPPLLDDNTYEVLVHSTSVNWCCTSTITGMGGTATTDGVADDVRPR